VAGLTELELVSVADKSLIERVAQGIRLPGAEAPPGVTGSILAQAAQSYGAKPVVDEATIPTGFDPTAAALFEAVVEGAFLVANSDGVFDDAERAAFESVVANATNHVVQMSQLHALLADLCEQLAEDGLEKRTRMVARTITRPDHQHDVLRIAALMAHISGGVSEQERAVMNQLAAGFSLEAAAVEHALNAAAEALNSSS